MQVTLNYFGAFREVGNQTILELQDGALISDLRSALIEQLKAQSRSEKMIELVAISQFANEKTLLAEEEAINANEAITILPPVSGG